MGVEQPEERGFAEVVQVVRIAIQGRSDGHRSDHLAMFSQKGRIVADQPLRVGQMFDGLQTDDAVERLLGAEALRVGTLVAEVRQAIVFLGIGDGRRVYIYTNHRLVRMQFGQQRGAVTTAAGHIEHALAAQAGGGEAIALHMDAQGVLVVAIGLVELLGVDAFNGQHAGLSWCTGSGVDNAGL